uniref:(northern house mosquito) hypothetical protein n=1 Tax=Culex pipiens TaxID=7175 RepID=A0A8D8HJP0_CULPI
MKMGESFRSVSLRQLETRCKRTTKPWFCITTILRRGTKRFGCLFRSTSLAKLTFGLSFEVVQRGTSPTPNYSGSALHASWNLAERRSPMLRTSCTCTSARTF